MNLQNLIGTTRKIATDPKGFWESHKVGSVPAPQTFTELLVPLVAAGTLAQFIKSAFIGYTVLGQRYTTPFFETLIGSIFSFFFSLAMCYVTAIIMSKLAVKLGGELSLDGALEFFALAGLVSFIGQIFILIPTLGMLIALVAGIYSLYILWLGVPSQTGVPEAERVKFLLLTLAALIAIGFVVGLIRYELFGF